MVASFKGSKKRLDLGLNGTSYLGLTVFYFCEKMIRVRITAIKKLKTPKSSFVPHQNAKNWKVACNKTPDHALGQSFAS